MLECRGTWIPRLRVVPRLRAEDEVWVPLVLPESQGRHATSLPPVIPGLPRNLERLLLMVHEHGHGVPYARAPMLVDARIDSGSSPE